MAQPVCLLCGRLDARSARTGHSGQGGPSLGDPQAHRPGVRKEGRWSVCFTVLCTRRGSSTSTDTAWPPLPPSSQRERGHCFFRVRRVKGQGDGRRRPFPCKLPEPGPRSQGSETELRRASPCLGPGRTARRGQFITGLGQKPSSRSSSCVNSHLPISDVCRACRLLTFPGESKT